MKLNIRHFLSSVQMQTCLIYCVCAFARQELANSFGASALPVTLIKDFLLI